MKKYFYIFILAFLITSQVFLPMSFSATMGLQIDMLLSQVRTNAGGSLSGGHVYFYAAGTSTPKDVYLDVNKVTPAANPYTLDSNGTAYLFGDGLYRIVITTAAGVTAYDRDNIRYEDFTSSVTGVADNTTFHRGDGTWFKLPRYFSPDAFTDNLTLYGNDLIANGPWVDVRAYKTGATCDNVTVQAAVDNNLNSGKSIFVPPECSDIGVDYKGTNHAHEFFPAPVIRRNVPLLNQTIGMRALPISLGPKPRGITFDGTHMWVNNFTGSSGPNTVSKIDISTNAIVATVTVGQWPWGSAFDGSHIWVANTADDTVSKIDILTNTVTATVSVGDAPTGVAFDGTHIWVTNRGPAGGGNSVSKININTNLVVATVVNANIIAPYGIAFDGTFMWVANFGPGVVDNTDTVSKISIITNAVVATVNIVSVAAPGYPAPLGVVYDGAYIWVSGYGNGEAFKISTTTNAVVASVNIGGTPEFGCFDGNNVWFTSNLANGLERIDVNSNTLLETVPTGQVPFACAFDGAYLWVTNFTDNNVVKLLSKPKTIYPYMDMGTLTVDVSTLPDNTIISSLKFQPTFVVVLASISGTPAASIGMWGKSNENYSILNNQAFIDNTWGGSNTRNIFLATTGSDYVRAQIPEPLPTGFSLNWDKTGSPTGTATIFWMAFYAFTP